MFTHRHYEEIAQTISTIAHPAVRHDVMMKFANMLSADNSGFNGQRFEKACFPDGNTKTPVEQAIEAMDEPKRTYARRTWAIWTNKSVNDEVPANISDRAKEDVRVELAHFNTKTGERI